MAQVRTSCSVQYESSGATRSVVHSCATAAASAFSAYSLLLLHSCECGSVSIRPLLPVYPLTSLTTSSLIYAVHKGRIVMAGVGAVVQYSTQLHRKPSRSFRNVYCWVHFCVTIKEKTLGPYNKKLQGVALCI